LKTRRGLTQFELAISVSIVVVVALLLVGIFKVYQRLGRPAAGERDDMTAHSPRRASSPGGEAPRFRARMPILDLSGFRSLADKLPDWGPEASFEDIGKSWRGLAHRGIDRIDQRLAGADQSPTAWFELSISKVALLHSGGETDAAYRFLEELRSTVERDHELVQAALGTVIYYQGVTAMRRGENENCILCRGESSCIIPIAPAAVHTNPAGSRLAIKHFTEYLDQYPNDLEVRWLLNLAHMTLGEYPAKVESRFRLNLDRFFHSDFDIGRFRDIGHLVGVNRFNQSGGAIMEDFDNDGLLDLAVTNNDATQPMSFYRNKGDGTFEDRSAAAGVTDQLGGLVCYQGDYDNDGYMDIFIIRGAWLPWPVRPTLLRNNGSGGFIDVTGQAGLLTAVNSNAAAWADYDNDGWLDLFIGCERQPNRLYHNRHNGTFEEVAALARVQGAPGHYCKGCAWIDFDNDDYPDLFVNHLNGVGQLFHNNRHGRFTDETSPQNIDGPPYGFSCWAWDYDNDGWLDLFATSYERTVGDVVKGLLGQPDPTQPNRLFRNLGGQGFEDLTEQAGLSLIFMTMGSNFADFDNDGWLDMYLATGSPSLASLVPNRMFKNVDGRRFSDITTSSGTGHLQKGHAVACGDWDRDGDIDMFVEMGGAVDGDRYHNILFQNPGQQNHWLTLKLIGKKTNRAAVGTRIKVVTAGEQPLTVHRHVSSGSSFGANTLQQTIGLGKADRVARLEIHWPTSRTTQVFSDIAADQALEVTELTETYRPLDWKPLPPIK
jgi:FG-GAP-like repeat/ASPIC and UnbV